MTLVHEIDRGQSFGVRCGLMINLIETPRYNNQQRHTH